MLHIVPLEKGQFSPLKVKFTGVRDKTAKQNISQHLMRIKQFHGFPNDKIVVHVVPREKLMREGIRAKFDSGDKKFYIDEHGTSFQHEFGHYIDRFVLGKDGKPWSENSSHYKRKFGFKKRPRDKKKYTVYYDPIRKVKGFYTPRKTHDTDFTGEYARSQPKEHFASAYNKVIGEQDGSEHVIGKKEVKRFEKILCRKLQRASLLIKEAANN